MWSLCANFVILYYTIKFIYMDSSFEKKSWFETKVKLMDAFKLLTEKDFQYMPGEESKVPEKIRSILMMSIKEFRKLILKV